MFIIAVGINCTDAMHLSFSARFFFWPLSFLPGPKSIPFHMYPLENPHVTKLQRPGAETQIKTYSYPRNHPPKIHP